MMSMPPKTRQLPLQFAHDPASSRDDLVISAQLHAALAMVDQWPDWSSPLVVLAGPPGSGKSHLAAIWAERAGARAIDLAGLDKAAVEALAGSPLLIEDVDRTQYDEAVLFHLINTVRAHGATALMTARQFPSAWPVTLPDLVSRLKAATVVEIGEPDEELLAQVMLKLFADRQLSVDDKLIFWLVARMERSLAAVRWTVNRLDQLALARGSKISRPLAAEVLAELDNKWTETDPS